MVNVINRSTQSAMHISGNESTGNRDSGHVFVLTENAEEVSITHEGVAFEHQLHDLECKKISVRAASFKGLPTKH